MLAACLHSLVLHGLDVVAVRQDVQALRDDGSYSVRLEPPTAGVAFLASSTPP